MKKVLMGAALAAAMTCGFVEAGHAATTLAVDFTIANANFLALGSTPYGIEPTDFPWVVAFDPKR